MKIYPGGNTQLFRQSGPVFSQHTESVSFIHQQQRAEFILQTHNFPKGGTVSIHAENGFGHYQNPAGRIRVPQMLQFFLNDSISLCRNVDKRAPDKSAPSIRLAWDNLSISTVSSRSAIEAITPREVA